MSLGLAYITYEMLQYLVIAASLFGLFIGFLSGNKYLIRTALVFAFGEWAFWAVGEYATEVLTQPERQAAIIALNVACCVAVVWKPAKLIQCWFGSAYAASALILGLYVIVFSGQNNAYYLAWYMTSLCSALQAALIFGWGGGNVGIAYSNIIGAFGRLAYRPHWGNKR